MPGRIHSRELKLEVCRQIANGEQRPAQVCREYQLASSLLARWRKEYDARGEAAFTPGEVGRIESQERRIAELERFCGQLAWENMLLKKGLERSRSRSGTP
jgi:transposase-like protein